MRLMQENDTIAIGRQRVDWADLRVFLAVAETKSFSAAAKLLGLTQPTVSRRLDDLEQRLNAQLVLRGLSGVSLTEAGEAIRDHVVTMERSAQAIERLALNRDKRDEGRVRLAAPDGLAGFWIAPRIAEFQRENPKIAISLDAGLWPNDPLREEIDLALQFEEEKRLDSVVQRLATYHYALFASSDYLGTYGKPRTLAEVADHRVILHSAQTRQPQSWHPKADALRALSGAQVETNSSAAVIFATRAGAGISLLPTVALTFAPELVMIGEEPLARLTLWLVHHVDAGKVERVRRVMDWLKRAFDNRTNPWFREEYVSPRQFMDAIPDARTNPAWLAPTPQNDVAPPGEDDQAAFLRRTRPE
ncbi:MAG: LysR family transcriptional regulator [Pseudomonadota bacterium]